MMVRSVSTWIDVVTGVPATLMAMCRGINQTSLPMTALSTQQ